MSGKRPTTIAEYIAAAPKEGQPHLRKLHAILKKAAPKATEAIKWGMPFFVEPRFVYSFSGHKAHCNFAPSEATLDHFRKALEGQQTTKHFLQIPYAKPMPEDLIRKIAEYQVKQVGKRKDDSFW